MWHPNRTCLDGWAKCKYAVRALTPAVFQNYCLTQEIFHSNPSGLLSFNKPETVLWTIAKILLLLLLSYVHSNDSFNIPSDKSKVVYQKLSNYQNLGMYIGYRCFFIELFHIIVNQTKAGFVTTMSFLVSAALDCSLYRWRLFLFVYFTFPSNWYVNKILKSNQTLYDFSC